MEKQWLSEEIWVREIFEKDTQMLKVQRKRDKDPLFELVEWENILSYYSYSS